jgi:hypothetical protein
MIGAHHHAQLTGLDGHLSNILPPRLTSNNDLSDLCLLSSWDYRFESPYLAFTLLLVICGKVFQLLAIFTNINPFVV